MGSFNLRFRDGIGAEADTDRLFNGISGPMHHGEPLA
jgi:hypothetical protein